MTAALAVFAEDAGLDAAHRAVLVWDGACAHTSRDLVVPEGIDLVALPPYSPELQPAERLWSRVDEPIDNRAVVDLNALEERCRTLRGEQGTIRNLTCYHWWPSDIAPAIRK